MGSRRTWITTDIWMDEPFQEASQDEKLLWFYLMTSPFSNSSGFYRLTKNYVEFALGQGFGELLTRPSKFYKYDEDTSQVFLPNYLHYNKASSPQQFTAIASSLDNLKLCPLFKDFFLSMRRWCGTKGFQYLSEPTKRYLTYLIEIETDTKDKILLKDILDNLSQ